VPLDFAVVIASSVLDLFDTYEVQTLH